MAKFYIQHGDAKVVRIADSRLDGAQMVLRDEIKKRNYSFSPFMMTSEQGFYEDIVGITGKDTDECKMMLTSNVAKSIAEESDNAEATEEWNEVAEAMVIIAQAYDGGEEYKMLLEDLA